MSLFLSPALCFGSGPSAEATTRVDGLRFRSGAVNRSWMRGEGEKFRVTPMSGLRIYLEHLHSAQARSGYQARTPGAVGPGNRSPWYELTSKRRAAAVLKHLRPKGIPGQLSAGNFRGGYRKLLRPCACRSSAVCAADTRPKPVNAHNPANARRELPRPGPCPSQHPTSRRRGGHAHKHHEFPTVTALTCANSDKRLDQQKAGP